MNEIELPKTPAEWKALADDLCRLLEKAYRRGFQQGHGVGIEKGATEEEVTRWRFASGGEYSDAVGPPGTPYAGEEPISLAERVLCEVGGCGSAGDFFERFLDRDGEDESPPTATPTAAVLDLKPAGTWGPWVFVLENFTLVGCGCEIDLEEIDSSAAILDWLLQVSGKQWASPLILSHLIQAFDDILEPQANFCSGGRERQGAGGGELARRYAEKLKASAP